MTAALAVSCLLFLAGFASSIYLWHLARQFPRAPFKQPSRLYAQPTRLAPGDPLTAGELVSELSAAGYRKADGEAHGEENAPLAPGRYRRSGDRVEVHLRRFPTPEGAGGGMTVEVQFRGKRVAELETDGRPAGSVTLEPALLASFYGPDLNERRPVTLDELPEEVIKAVLAAEDDNFFVHPGVSPTGIARALWVNLRGGELQQGGSTVTQQLVKNLYLSSERTIKRKAKEAFIAMALEARYGKQAILEAYLNEIYLGRSGPANVIGLGAAARAYFSKDASELTLAEGATLAAMIQSPGDYLPTKNPDGLIDRRNWVLQRMAELGWVPEERARRAWQEPIVVRPQKVNARPLAPYFSKLATEEAEERFGIDELPDEGYILFSTIRRREQRQAEKAVKEGLAALERRSRKEPLQAALISVDPRDGSIRAYVGGRDFSVSQFDRVSQAHRQIGSAVKPVIYAAAFSEAVATPATMLRDSPITVKISGRPWKPNNNDRGFRGWVTARAALEQSLNIPTIRLSLQVGLNRVVDLARDMGIDRKIDPNPSLALGAFEVSPRELAQVYATLANDGLRPPLHGLATVLDRHGEVILGDDLPSPRRVLPPQAAFLVTSILQGALDHGTGAGVRSWGLRDPLAGKTGTTNDRRDNWFAGYSADRVTVVWVGYDDNSRTRLSGARAALPIWSRFMLAVRPARGYPAFAPPEGMSQVTIDPLTGQLATEYCPHRVTELLPEWQVPTEPCHRHMPGYNESWADVNLSGVPIDPATGEPLDGYTYDAYGTEAAYGTYDPGYYQTYEGYDENEPLTDIEPAPGELPYPPASTFPPEPVEVDPEEDEDYDESEEGTIVIRPALPEPAPPPAEEPPIEEPPVEEPPAQEGPPPSIAAPTPPASPSETPPPPAEDTPPPPEPEATPPALTP